VHLQKNSQITQAQVVATQEKDKVAMGIDASAIDFSP
jgi:hypothetical protein